MRHEAVNRKVTDTVTGKLKEECGVFGVCLDGDAAQACAYGLTALQHRGQEGAGVAVGDGAVIRSIKGMGLVSEVFSDAGLDQMPGGAGIGHVLNLSQPAAGDIVGSSCLQPFVFRFVGGMMAVALNGKIANAEDIRERLGLRGVVFQSDSDSEVVGCLIARHYSHGMGGAIERAVDELAGAYSFVVLYENSVYAARDRWGFRPLVLGSGEAGYGVASESCALDVLSLTDRRDVRAGEIVEITRSGVRTVRRGEDKPAGVCAFEYIYFARPDSVIDGASVDSAREALGAQLARECPIEADVVVAVPDSGISAAQGYSAESGIPYQRGLVRNRYLGRTFIRPAQGQRELGVRLKLNAVERSCAGKRVVLVDDSIVRGTTAARLVDLMRRAGAREVHMAIASPPVTHSCRYGISTAGSDELVAASKSHDEILKMIGADSLHHISVEGMEQAILSKVAANGYGPSVCTGCFTGTFMDQAPAQAEGAVDGTADSCEAVNTRDTCGACCAAGAGTAPLTYRDSGVDIDEGNRAVELMKASVRSTFTAGVLTDIGGFGGLFRPDLAGMKDPVLVSGTDGVGTKLKVAFATGKHNTIGIDAVAMCVNDVLVSGARPLFFLDYIGCGRLEAEQIAAIVDGVAEGCRRAGCALIGGETAEMPGFYADGEYDIAGFAVGVADRSSIIDGSRIAPGDVVVGLRSSGLHSNGYSLARKALLDVAGYDLDDVPPGLGCSVGQAMLEPTRIYARPILSLMRELDVLGMAHITGGGLVENPPRVLPEGTAMELDLGSWQRPAIFDLVQSSANVTTAEMLRVFNMGIGFMVIVKPDQALKAVEILSHAGEEAGIIGRIIEGNRQVVFRGCRQ